MTFLLALSIVNQIFFSLLLEMGKIKAWQESSMPWNIYRKLLGGHLILLKIIAIFCRSMVDRTMTRTSPPLEWIYGLHSVQAALNNRARKCYQLLTTKEMYDLIKDQQSTLKAEVVSRRDLDQRFGSQTVHQGIALSCSFLPEMDIETLCDKVHLEDLFLILDQITDPHNIGAIARSAAAFKVKGIILQERHSPKTSAILNKVASGGIEHVPLIYVTNLSRTLDYLKSHDIWCYGLDERGSDIKTHLTPEEPRASAIVLGAEGKGLRRLVREKCDKILKVPTAPYFPTLNVSSTAAITLFAFRNLRS